MDRRPYLARLEDNDVPRPHVGYCILKAAEQAKLLGYNKISIIEFGVAGGRGLLSIEYHIEEIKNVIDMDFEVYGFDSGQGLPKPTDPRDCPYLWFEGDFAMDYNKLQSSLKYSTLVIGDVKETCATFHDKYEHAPIACVFNDLDYYSSTKASLEIFNCDPKHYLPRIPFYLDDIIGRFEYPMNDFVGELAAVHEFNATQETKKIGKINGLCYKQKRPAKWHEKIFIFQDFNHPRYADPIRMKQPDKCKI